MRKSKKTLVTVATLLLCVGVLLGFIGLAAVGFDFKKLNSADVQVKTYTVEGEFQNIAVENAEHDLRFLPTTDGECKVVCSETEKITYTVSVADGVLSVLENDARKWYDRIGFFSWDNTAMEIYLPRSAYDKLEISGSTGDVRLAKEFAFEEVKIDSDTGDVEVYASIEKQLTVSTDTGDIAVENISPEQLHLSTDTGEIDLKNLQVTNGIVAHTDTGDIQLTNAECLSLKTNTSTGDVILKNVITKGHVSIETSTGNVKLTSCDGDAMKITTSTGNVSGSLLSEKRFQVKTSTGNVSVPQNTTGGICTVTTSTGNITISIE